jgi:hypothetical protein
MPRKINHHVVTQDIEDDLGIYHGVMAISPARAVWEVACRSSLESGVVTADSALYQDPQLREALEELQLRFAYFGIASRAAGDQARRPRRRYARRIRY